jgi:hypothetical protein
MPDAGILVTATQIGLGATLLMDLWNLFLKRAFGVPSLNYCLLGRWVGHIPSGKVRHESIAAAPQKRFECVVGWVSHYTIGVFFAVAFVSLVSAGWLTSPSLLPALLYGIVTVVFPLFLMQPALGLGIASSKTSNPGLARLKSLATHTMFGIGLYMCAVATQLVLRLG